MCLPTAHGHVLQADELDLVDGDVGNLELRVCVLLHCLVFLVLLGLGSVTITSTHWEAHVKEPLDRLRDILCELGAGDGHGWASEIPRWDLSAPRGITRPLVRH